MSNIIISLGIPLAAVTADRPATVSTILLRFCPLACPPAQHSADLGEAAAPVPQIPTREAIPLSRISAEPRPVGPQHRVRLLIAQTARTLPIARIELVLQYREPTSSATLANASQTVHIPIQARGRTG